MKQTAILFFHLLLFAGYTHTSHAGQDELEGYLTELRESLVTNRPQLSAESIDRLEQQCRADHGEGCRRLADFVNYANSDVSQKLWLFSCNSGYGLACEEYVAYRQSILNYSPTQVLADNELAGWIEKSCDVSQPVLNVAGCERYAMLLRKRGASAEALSLLRSLARVSGDGHGKLGLAEMAEEQGETDFACAYRHAACLQRVLESCKLAAQCSNQLPKLMKDNGRTESIDPSSDYSFLATAAFERGDLQSAQSIYKLLCDFGTSDSRNRLGEVYSCARAVSIAETIRDIQEQLPELERQCLETQQDDVCDEMYALYRRAGRYEDAAKGSEGICDPDSDISSFQTKLACLRRVKDLEDAKRSDDALKLITKLCNRGDQDHCYKLALLKEQTNEADDAFTLASKSCIADPPTGCSLRDRLLAKQGKSAAENYYNQHCSKNEPASCLNLYFLRRSKNTSDAKEVLSRTLGLVQGLCSDTALEISRSLRDQYCLAEASVYCIQSKYQKGTRMFEKLCDSGSAVACRILRTTTCEKVEKEMLEEVEQRFTSH